MQCYNECHVQSIGCEIRKARTQLPACNSKRLQLRTLIRLPSRLINTEDKQVKLALGRRVECTAPRISNHVAVLLERDLSMTMAQLLLHNSEWSTFFK